MENIENQEKHEYLDIDLSKKIHELFNDSTIKNYSYPYNENSLPKNGIYILFEKGQMYNEYKRIVAVGGNTENDQLRTIINQHFGIGDTSKSSLRKNIGDAIINLYVGCTKTLSEWKNSLKKNNKKIENKSIPLFSMNDDQLKSMLMYSINKDYIDRKMTLNEKLISDYIQYNFSFVVLEVTDNILRKKLISFINDNCSECNTDFYWLGSGVTNRGMWINYETNTEINSEFDSKEMFEKLKNIIHKDNNKVNITKIIYVGMKSLNWCLHYEPIFDACAEDFEEKHPGEIEFIKLDADENKEQVEDLSLGVLPATLFYYHDKLIEKQTGILDYSTLHYFIYKYR